MRGYWGKQYVIILGLTSLTLFVAGSWEKGFRGVAPSQVEAISSFFHGKNRVSGVGANSCRAADDCHVQFPHREGGKGSAFVNMHAYFLDCQVCHAASGTSLYVEPARGRKFIRAEESGSAGDPHGAIEKPLSCRDCHSPAGAGRLEERAKTKFKDGFADPFALKLIEEDSKKWEFPGF